MFLRVRAANCGKLLVCGLVLVSLFSFAGTDIFIVGPLRTAHAYSGTLFRAPQTFTVTSTDDSDDGTCDAHCTLREAINAANATPDPDTIDFSLVYPATIPLTDWLPNIDQPLTINGPGAGQLTIDGDNAYGIFGVYEPVALNISGLTLRNGHQEVGGAVHGNPGSVITISDCVLDGNTAAHVGGAIHTYQGTVTVTGTTFTNNFALNGGGAIFNSMGVLVEVTSSDFVNNGTHDAGGAISARAGAPTIVTDSTFTNNHADRGGAISHDGSLTLTNSTFTGNDSTDDGGAIEGWGDFTISGSAFTNNVSGGSGGAIASGSGVASISNSTFTSNHAIRGGAIANRTSMSITNSTFTGNTSDDWGGAIRNEEGTLTVTGCEFSENSSGISGGVIDNPLGTLTVVDSVFTNNYAQFGGALLNWYATLEVTGSTFTNNSAQWGGALNTNYGPLTVTNSTFTGNTADEGGGVINTNESAITVTGCTLDQNQARFGGGIVHNGGPMTVTDTVFSNNQGGAYNGHSFDTPYAITSSCIVNNQDTAVYSDYATLDVTGNWWGAADGPSGAGPGSGDSAAGDVNFSGFLAAPILGCSTKLEAPGNLVGSMSSPTQAELSWDDNSADETAFHIERLAEGAEWVEIDTVGADTTTYTDTGLTPNILYDYRVRAFRSSDSVYSAYSNTVVVISSVEILPPPQLRIPRDGQRIADTTPVFKWKKVTGAVDYQLQVSSDPAFGSPEIDRVVDGSSYVVPPADALPYASFWWRMRTRSTSGYWGDWSSVYSTEITLLKSPDNGDFTNDTTPTFRWSKVTGATQYHLQVSASETFDTFAINEDTLTGTKFTPVTDLLHGRYYWRIEVDTGSGYTDDWTPVWTFTVTPKPPDRPTLIAPANKAQLTDPAPAFTWEPVPDGDTYQIQIDDQRNFKSPLQDDTGDTASYAADALPDGRYYWRVRAFNNVGVAGKWSKPWRFIVDTTGPDAPVLLAPPDLSATGDMPTLTWKKVKQADSYRLRVSMYSTLSVPVIDEPGLAGTSFTPATALSDATYYWAVRSTDKLGNGGPWSETRSFTVNSALNPPDTPVLTGPVDGALLNTTNPELTWNPAAGATWYQVQIDDKANFRSPEHDISYVESPYFTPPLADDTYYWRVRAINAENVAGDWSDGWSFTVDTIVPAAPKLKSPRMSSYTPDATPTFKWKKVKGGVTYWLQVSQYDPNFPAPIIDNDTLTDPIFTPADVDALPYASYFWRVSALDAAGNWGPWSDTGYFEVTVHKSPKMDTITSNARPTFKWVSDASATSYCFQIDTDAEFVDPLVINETGLTSLSYRPATPLAAGNYYWHVGIDNAPDPGCEVWMVSDRLKISSTPPERVKLEAPKNRALLNDSTPTLQWKPADGADRYALQVAWDRRFNNSVFLTILDAADGTSPTLPSLADGQYYWHVLAINSSDTLGKWSATWTFTIDTTPPTIPIPIAPAPGARVTNPKLKFEWYASEGAYRYEIQIDTDPMFPLPPRDVGRKTRYTPSTSLAQGTYYWRVRAIDKAGNVSLWSDMRVFHLVAGNTIVTTPAPLPTPAPTQPAPPHKPADEPAIPAPPVINTPPPARPPEPAETPDRPPRHR